VQRIQYLKVLLDLPYLILLRLLLRDAVDRRRRWGARSRQQQGQHSETGNIQSDEVRADLHGGGHGHRWPPSRGGLRREKNLLLQLRVHPSADVLFGAALLEAHDALDWFSLLLKVGQASHVQ